MEPNTSITKVALADDHVVLREALAAYINNFPRCQVIFQADNGKEVLAKIEAGTVPDVLILDQNMPEMDGFSVAEWLYAHHRSVHIIMLSMFNSELSMIRLLRYGVKGFLKKDSNPSELKDAIEMVVKDGFYNTVQFSDKLVDLVRTRLTDELQLAKLVLTDKEITFLKLCATELSYRGIGKEMQLSPRSLEQLRKEVFAKLEVQSRVGLVLIAVRHGFVSF